MAVVTSRIVPLVVLVMVIAVVLGVTALRSNPDNDSGAKDTPAPTPSPAAEVSRPTESHRTPDQLKAEADAYLQKVEAARASAGRKAEAAHHASSARFSSERVDARWAAERRAAILAASKGGQISDLGAEPLRLDSECRTTTCRIEVDFATRVSAQDWLTLFLMNVGADLPHATFEHSTNADGSARVTVYGRANR